MVHWIQLNLSNKDSVKEIKRYIDAHDCKLECFFDPIKMGKVDYIKIECEEKTLDLDFEQFSPFIKYIHKKPTYLIENPILTKLIFEE